MMPRTISPEARERMRAGGRKGGRTRAQAFTSQYQSAVASCKPSEQLAAAGRAGWNAFVAKHGIAAAARRVAEHRLKHPSGLEQRVMQFLDSQGVAYLRETEAEIEVDGCLFYPDFSVGERSVIEVNGRAWHEEDWHGRDVVAQTRTRGEILAAAGYRVLTIREAEIDDHTAWPRLSAWLQGEPA